MIDKHHILFPRVEYEARSESKLLRRTSILVPKMERQNHVELHKYSPALPALGYFALTSICHEFEPTDNTMKSIDNLMLAIEHAGNRPKAHEVERQLGELVVWAIDLQRPFIALDQNLNNRRIL